MSFIVFHTHGSVEYAVNYTYEKGNNLVFENKAAAEQEASDCLDGRVEEI
jgi:hypothetical protein